MKTYTINNVDYYNALDLKDKSPFAGCSGSNSTFIKKRGLSKNDYAYYKLDGNKYDRLTRGVKGSVLMVSKEWVDNYMGAIEERLVVEPPLLSLPLDDKLFVDEDGNSFKVEVRGTRDYDDCYFLAKDLGKCFGLKNIENTILNVRGSYEKNIHYKRFIKNTKVNSTYLKDNVDKLCRIPTSRIFLTYIGVLNLVFTTRSNKTISFAKWASKIVFTAHLGTSKQRMDMMKDVCGLNETMVKKFFKVCVANVSGIYLIRLGVVRDLREILQIDESVPDDHLVCKYGRADKIAERFQQHVSAYNKIGITDISLVYYFPVDSELASKAETRLKNQFIREGLKLDVPKHTELIAIDQNHKGIKSAMLVLYEAHNSTIVSLSSRHKEIEAQLALRDKDIELLQERIASLEESKSSETKLLQERIESSEKLYRKDVEILELKIAALEKRLAKSKGRVKKKTRLLANLGY